MKIDHEFKRYIRPLNQQEYEKLKESILAEGIRDSLICWNGILLDGYHRYQIAQENDLEYSVTEIELADRDAAKEWMITNQLGRRNLTPEEASYYRGKLYEARKRQGARTDLTLDHFDTKLNTAEIIAKEYGVSEPTVKRDAVFSRAVDKVAEVAGDEIRDAILSGAAKVPKQDVDKLLDIHEQAPELLPKIASGEMTIPDARREVKKREVINSLESIEAKETKALEGVYDVIVIDPPWAMQKIERDVAPEQVAFEYPTMTNEEIKSMTIPMADNCHVFLWTTQKYLPVAFDILAAWGLKYVCTFVWHKNGGFQPFGMPQYNCEFILYARHGTPSFIDFKMFFTCFNANRGKHSEKPEEFYALLRRVTAGRRLDMFNRRAIEGFDGYGLESPDNV